MMGSIHVDIMLRRAIGFGFTFEPVDEKEPIMGVTP